MRADPTYERAHFHLGLIYIKLNKLQQARDFFETTLQLNSTHTDAAILVSYTQYVAENYTGVVNVLSTISLDDMIDSSYFDVISLLGNSYIGLGMYDQAQELYDSVLSRDAENLGALNGLGIIIIIKSCTVTIDCAAISFLYLFLGILHGHYTFCRCPSSETKQHQ